MLGKKQISLQISTAFFSLIFIFASLVSVNAQGDACYPPLSTDIQLTGRLCFGGVCLDADDFVNLKVNSFITVRLLLTLDLFDLSRLLNLFITYLSNPSIIVK